MCGYAMRQSPEIVQYAQPLLALLGGLGRLGLLGTAELFETANDQARAKRGTIRGY